MFGRLSLLAIALLLMPGSRKFLRSATKEAVRAGIVVADKVKEIVEEVKEEASDTIAEARAERGDHKKISHDSQTKHTHKST